MLPGYLLRSVSGHLEQKTLNRSMVIETNKICAQTLDSVTLRNYKLPHSIHKAK